MDKFRKGLVQMMVNVQEVEYQNKAEQETVQPENYQLKVRQNKKRMSTNMLMVPRNLQGGKSEQKDSEVSDCIS